MSDLHTQTEAARVLLANMRDVIGDDEDLALSTIEGETGLLEAIDEAVNRLSEINSLLTGTQARIDDLKAREARYEAQAERIRTAIMNAMQMAGLKKLERSEATLSLRAVAAKAIVKAEADIPAGYWKAQAPKLDLKALTAALKDGANIPGAELSNGGETLSIRRA